MEKCKACQQEIDSKATICPHCRTKQGLGKTATEIRNVVIVLVGLGIAGVIIFNGNETEKVGTNDSTSNSNGSPSISTQQTVYKIADQVKSGDYVFSVNSVRKSTGTQYIKPADGSIYLIPNVTIQNNSKDKATISTLIQMYIKDSEGNKYTPAIFSDATGKVDGELLAGDKVKGDVGFEIPTTAKGLKFYFNPNWISGESIVVDLGI